jgi:hypothetical protein
MTTEVSPYIPGEESWESLVASADEVLGHELLSGEAADKLIGVPFIITRVVFRDGILRAGSQYRDDYVSCEAVVAPKEVLAERARKGRLDLDSISVDPGEHIVFNDGSTGIYRQIVQYLESKGLIKLPAGPEAGAKGESRFDLPRSQWYEGDDKATEGIHVRLLCPRGLRYSEYVNDYSPDGAKTRYIA